MIPQYRTILYATDLTPNATTAFRHAVGIARCHNARIHLLHVMPEMEPAVLNYVSTVMGEDKLADFELEHKQEVSETIRQQLKAFAEEELANHPEDLARIAAIEIHHGHAVGLILELSDRIEADLVVLGSHGKGALKYTFLGSVAEKVLRKSRRPVLVVPLHHPHD
ncbi:MAG: universal stress protein [Desulfuromonadales bacterium]|nr:universal stress protein [Desulfuromonadales bacterium]MDW7757080.1 universal stress protein [Desulfuromonadales bacterium]